jgi:hypothetical protein
MIEGPMPNLISLGKKPDFIAFRNLQNLPTSFNFEDGGIQKEINRVIRTTNYLPGYYEFSLARIDDQKNILTPFFYEYSNREYLYKEWQQRSGRGI